MLCTHFQIRPSPHACVPVSLPVHVPQPPPSTARLHVPDTDVGHEPPLWCSSDSFWLSASLAVRRPRFWSTPPYGADASLPPNHKAMMPGIQPDPLLCCLSHRPRSFSAKRSTPWPAPRDVRERQLEYLLGTLPKVCWQCRWGSWKLLDGHSRL